MTRAIRNIFGAAALVAAASLAAGAHTAAAQAYPRHEVYSPDPSVVVAKATIPLAGLDLTSPAGARTLLDRIETAAGEVCGGDLRAVSRSAKADYRACRAEAISGAVARMQAPALAALVAGSERRAAR